MKDRYASVGPAPRPPETVGYMNPASLQLVDDLRESPDGTVQASDYSKAVVATVKARGLITVDREGVIRLVPK